MTTLAHHDEILNEKKGPLPRQTSVTSSSVSSGIIALRSVLLDIAVNDPDDPPTVQQ